ncbi:MAG: GNAT family N-acetyltransferase [Pseudopedobacter saltans]|uniref:GNAT family N-acetyltransferase n=1 Tax=Pseudopedobacter saltans TaxID=151895 RepID=A0A2W5F5T4_9SPHI|nr:MAG: GNAT family N-acetyltransferase [Pseudopedobacter saltans]
MTQIRLISYNSPEYQQQVNLRYEVLRAPLGLQFSPEYLAKDAADLMFGFFQDGQLLACCQLTDIGNHVFQLRQMAVSPKMQGQNLGRKIVLFVEDYIRKIGGVTITLHAREVARGFYEKLGYAIVGDPFEEVGIPHYNMNKSLSA